MANVRISELTAVSSLDGTELVEVVQAGTNKKATISQIAEQVEGLGQFIATIGDGSAINIDVTHNLNTRNVHVSVRRATTPWDQVFVDNECPTVNKVTLKFGAVAPGANAFVVTVSK